MRKMLNLIPIFLVLPIAFASLMYFQQPGMIFFPFSGVEKTPSDWGLQYEDITFKTEDGLKLNGWFIPAKGAVNTLLFFHGNAGNISHRGESVQIFHRLGLNVFIVDYRGYGKSEGKPSEHGLYADADAAWQYLTKDKGIKSEDIIIFGRSLGGAVATHLAAKVNAGKLILESTFSSGKDMAKALFPVLQYFIYVRFRFDNAQKIQQVHYPVMVIHSLQDEIIPFDLGRKLYEAANEPKTFYELKGDHNGGFYLSQPGYEQALRRFLGSAAGVTLLG